VNLSVLTTSGWVLFALAIGFWCCFIQDCLRLANGKKPFTDVSPIAVGVATAWLLYLVTP
jgi:hypothetical protein